MYYLFFIVSLLACVIGNICGVGGGVLIKPVLDASGMLSVKEISFLSGCTVLAMSLYSTGAAVFKRESDIKLKTTVPLAIGSVIGGVTGKFLFDTVIKMT